MNDTPSIIALLRARIAELDAEQTRLIRALDALTDDSRAPAPAVKPRRKPAPPGTTEAKIVGYVTEHPGTRPREIVKATGMPSSMIGTTLTKLAREGKVRRTVHSGSHTTYDIPPPGDVVKLNVQTVGTPARELRDRRVAYVTQEG